MARTYIDSGVLIYAAKGVEPASALALPFVTDPKREYVTSDYVHLEVFPKAKFHNRTDETKFYEGFFAANLIRITGTPDLIAFAMEEACACGMSAIDALHVACAVFAGASELITSERITKPLHRTRKIRVISIFPSGPEKSPTVPRRIATVLHRVASFIERHAS
ncbi:MAG: type II toxin-antitoxin system VapC family toxin [Terriglobia bacterium]